MCPRLDRRELATVLAALRHYQNEGDLGTSRLAGAAVQQIATDDGRFEPLCPDEIGALCERLNLGMDESASSPRVVLAVRGGVAEVLAKPQGVAVSLYDYDVEGDEDGVSRDSDGEACRIFNWDEDEEVKGGQDA